MAEFKAVKTVRKEINFMKNQQRKTKKLIGSRLRWRSSTVTGFGALSCSFNGGALIHKEEEDE